MNKQYKISVYAICKNEEQFVDRWIQSMYEADEIVVLDTGSTDKTVELLQKYEKVKVKVKKIKPWRFDVARNESMKLISSDMDIAVCTDLDEVFEPGWADILRREWKEDTGRAKYSYVWEHTPDGGIHTHIWYQKIHKNTNEWSWKQPVHEYLTNNNDYNTVFLPPSFRLHHYPDNTKSRSNYLSLAKLGVEESPNELLTNFYYLRELILQGQNKEAIEFFFEVKKNLKSMLFSSDPYAAAMVMFMALAYKRLKRYIEAEAYYEIGIKQTNSTREIHASYVFYLYELKKWEKLIEVGEQALLIPKQINHWYEEEKNYKEFFHDYLSIAYWNTKEYEKALHHIALALMYAPTNQRMLDNKEIILRFLNK